MNDDDKIIPSGNDDPSDGSGEPAAADGTSDAQLNEELESLRDTFQEVLDETTAEAEKQPVIQELDYRAEEPAEENADDSAAQNETDVGSKKAKKKKENENGKKSHKLLWGILIALGAVILFFLVAYVIVTIKEPNFNNYLAAYSAAESAETPAEKVTGYESALTYCGEESILGGFRQELLEKIAVATCESEGYAAAYTYMTQNITEDMQAAPKTREFREFLSVGDSLSAIADTAFDKVIAAVGDAKTDEEVDYDALLSELNVSDLIAEDVKTALTYLGQGVAAENKAESKEDFQMAISSYLNAYSSFGAMGAECPSLLESVTVKMFDNGYAYETKILIDQYLTPDTAEGEEAAPESEEIKEIRAQLDAITAYDADLFAVAQKQVEEGKYTAEDIIAALGDTGLSEKALKAVGDIALTAAEALQAEKEQNLSKAALYYGTVLGIFDTFSFPAQDAAAKAINVYVQAGDTQSANSVKESFFAEEDAAADEETAALLTELDALYSAQAAVNEVFEPYYYNYAYYGSELNKEEIIAALDAVLKDNTGKYYEGFVNYYKYLTESFTDKDQEAMGDYVDKFSADLADYPMIYGHAAIQYMQDTGDLAKAAQIADKMLAADKSDDHANSIKAFVLRAQGDVDGALEAAENGAELSSAVEFCSYEIAICDLLKGDLEGAFDVAKQLYESSLTTGCCQLIMVIAAKYDGADETMKQELATYSAEIEQLYANYGLEASAQAKGLIDGTLTFEDVFLNEPYDFG